MFIYIYLLILSFPIFKFIIHCNDVIMSAMASQIISLVTVYLTVNSGADKRKHQSSASLAFVRGIHLWSVNSPYKGPMARKMFPFDDVNIIMNISSEITICSPPRNRCSTQASFTLNKVTIYTTPFVALAHLNIYLIKREQVVQWPRVTGSICWWHVGNNLKNKVSNIYW